MISGLISFICDLLWEVVMISASRRWTLAASAVALISSQAAWASPVTTARAADPLVSLSLLGTEQSRAAVCGTASECAVPAGLQPIATATSPAVAGTAAAAALQYPPERQVGVDWPGLVVLFAVPVAIVLAIALEGGNNEPVSPA